MIEKLEANLAGVRSRIDSAARRAGRRGDEIALVAVTKTVEPELAAELVRLGQLDLGESRAAELERKDQALRALGLAPRWHFLGHLQKNKVRRVVALASSIHSIDSAALLDAVDRTAGELGVRPEVWIQVKLTQEPTKTGLLPAEAAELYARAAALEHVRLAGLMTLAPLPAEGPAEGPAERPADGPADGAGEAEARAVFRDLAKLAAAVARAAPMRDALRPERARMSMGMSGDFEWAVEEGSDVVRIGSLLFEEVAA